MKLIKNTLLLTIAFLLVGFSFSEHFKDNKTCIKITDIDSVNYSKQIKTSLILLRLIKANERDSILNFYLNGCWIKRYQNDISLYNSTLDDAIRLINEFGMPTLQQMTIIKGSSRQKCEPDFPDKYGVAIRYNLSQNSFKRKYGLIEFYFTEDQCDKVSIIFSSNPNGGRK